MRDTLISLRVSSCSMTSFIHFFFSSFFIRTNKSQGARCKVQVSIFSEPNKPSCKCQHFLHSIIMFPFRHLFLLASALILCSHKSHSFCTKPALASMRRNTLKVCYVGSKYFQLEELEDREASTTEVFLSSDGRVMLTETDGPPPTSATGNWEKGTNNDFKMTLVRSFGGGRSSSDIGEFSFTVERRFTGELSLVGGSVHISGSMYSPDDILGDMNVGFFSMIDTTDARLDVKK